MKYLQLLSILLVSLVLINLNAEMPFQTYPKYFPAPDKNVNWRASQAKDIQTPKFLSSVNDPDTAYKVWRLGGSSEEMGGILEHPDGNGSITLTHAQHFYSQTNPTNSTETFAIGSAGRNHNYAALWRLSDKKLVAWVPSPKNENDIAQRQLLWDKKIPNVYWYVDANKLMKVELNFVDSSARSLVWDVFPKYESITFGLGGGDFSDDGSKIVLVGKPRKRKDSNDFVILSYLVNTKKIISKMAIKEKEGVILDWAGVDPSGAYIIFNEPSRAMSWN